MVDGCWTDECGMNGADEQTECRESKECAAPKHHFDECVERVTAAEDKGGSKEDCVEECKSFPSIFIPFSSCCSREGRASRGWGDTVKADGGPVP